MSAPLACLFPTFVMRRAEAAVERLPGLGAYLGRLVERASAVVPITPDTFVFYGPEDLIPDVEATRRVHYACYIEGVAAAAWVEARLGPGTYAAGYSMGLFAALCHAGACRFEDGLRLMDRVCVAAHAAVPSHAYAVGAIEGLDADRVRALLAGLGAPVDLIDVYGRATCVVSGRAGDVRATVDAAARAGAVYTRVTPATAPYHSTALAGVEPIVRDMLGDLPVTAPRLTVISAITAQPLTTAEDVRDEVARNVTRPMNWYATMRRLSQAGIGLLCECGASQSLGNMARRELSESFVVQDLPALAPPAPAP